MMSQVLKPGGAGTSRVVETLKSAFLPMMATTALWRSSRPSFSQCQAPSGPSPVIGPSSPGQRTRNASSSREEQPQLRYKAVTVDLFGTLLGEAIGEAKVLVQLQTLRSGMPPPPPPIHKIVVARSCRWVVRRSLGLQCIPCSGDRLRIGPMASPPFHLVHCLHDRTCRCMP